MLVFKNRDSDLSKFPYAINLNTNADALGRAFGQVMLMFDWRNFAYIYTSEQTTQKCDFIQDDLENILHDYNLNLNFHQLMNTTTSAADFSKVLSSIKPFARIVVGCFDTDEQKRNFLLGVYDAGIATNDWVFLFLELRNVGFNAMQYSVNGTVRNIWETDSGIRDNDAHKAAYYSFVLDVNNINGNYDYDFDKKVMPRANSYPFYCTDCNLNNSKRGSVFSRNFHDAFYLFTLAVNKTIAMNADKSFSNASQIMDNSILTTFEGKSGFVNIDSTGMRTSHFDLFGINHEGVAVPWINISISNNSFVALPFYTDAATTIWSNRNGIQPKNIPSCGFSELSCPSTSFEKNKILIISTISIALFSAFVAILSTLCIASISKQQKNALMDAYQIHISRLTKPNKSKSNSKSRLSILTDGGTSKSASNVLSDDEFESHYYLLDNDTVFLQKLPTRLSITDVNDDEACYLIKVEHDNLNKFMGIIIGAPIVSLVWKYCRIGTLSEVLQKSNVNIDGYFMATIMKEIISGLNFIHHSKIGFHGSLNSNSVLLNDRWQIKLSGFGMSSLKSAEEAIGRDILFKAPEVLQDITLNNTRESDIYSYGLICVEVIKRDDPWDLESRNQNLDELIYIIKRDPKSIRPIFEKEALELGFTNIMTTMINECLHELPRLRLKASQILSLINGILGKGKKNLMDHIFKVLEEYAFTLQGQVEERTQEIREEQRKSELLLSKMLPKEISEKLKSGQSIPPEHYDEVSIMFTDIVKFGELSNKSTPLQLINVVNNLFSLYDEIIESFDSVYKIESIADGYLVSSGVPKRNGHAHLKEIALLSFEFMNSTEKFVIPHLKNYKLQLRIGLHTGSCVASVVGNKMPRYCLFGDTINTTSRMESNGKPGFIHMTSDMNSALLNHYPQFKSDSRGEILVKGKGVMETYFLLR
uniref:Guanylate cyclase n=1 Tax=Rhabditophanes sp. KR3021 TaxID=114890 RepID=A0AC35TPS7_9BILA